MIDSQVIEEIKSRNDIVDVISSYVVLKRAGSNMQGLCPFHSEKSPSFTVFTGTQGYYCFGCGAGGDVITFVRQVENLDYVSSLEFLAKRAGVTIPEDKGRREKSGFDRNRMFEMNRDAARFFRESLFNEQIGGEALSYLKRRGLDAATVKRFGIGYSPNDFSALTKHMRALGYSEEELIAGFLCGRSQKYGTLFDYFRNRVMFPIIDVSGNVIAFGGRVMDDSQPKYLNSSDTPVFKKSRNLFALNFARVACSEELILCEGYMDVIALHAAGFTNAVATLGTAITPEQARIMSRYTKKVLISYDSDAAGQKAANRAIGILGEVGLDVRVLKIKDAKDPDEYIKKFGADSFSNDILAASRGKFEYNMDSVLARHNILIPDEKIKACNELCAMISDIYSSAEREVYISAVSDKLGIPKDSIRADINRILKKKKNDFKKQESQKIIRQSAGFGDRVNPDYAKNIAAAKAEESVLGMLLLYPEHRKSVLEGKCELNEKDFFTEFGKRVFTSLIATAQNGNFETGLLGEFFTPEEQGRIMRMQLSRSQLSDNGADAFNESIRALKRETAFSDSEDSVDNILDIIKNKRNNT
ncbi:MAG: DNA primase [Ruminococcaceae bacterium]|nr:DNA primase [Oscillospiraceae bacterium]